MATNETSKMLNAIFAGREHIIETPELEDVVDQVTIIFRENEIVFEDGAHFNAKVRDIQTAREIAGALVAWANKQEDRAFTGEEADAGMTLFGWSDIDHKYHPVNQSRAKWYQGTVRIMSDDALKRNYTDNKSIANALAAEAINGDNSKHSDIQDIRRALDIMYVEMQRRGLDV